MKTLELTIKGDTQAAARALESWVLDSTTPLRQWTNKTGTHTVTFATVSEEESQQVRNWFTFSARQQFPFPQGTLLNFNQIPEDPWQRYGRALALRRY